MSKKYFMPVRMESMYLSSKLHGVVYQVSGADAIVDDGSFCVLGDFYKDSIYSGAFTAAKGSAVDILDFNTRYAAPPAAATATGVCVIDLAEVPTATNGDLVYRIGTRTIGLINPAGKVSRARELVVNDTFRLGEENFASAPTVGQFAVLTADSPLLTPAATAPTAGGFYAKVVQKTVVTEGISTPVNSYLLLVMAN